MIRRFAIALIALASTIKPINAIAGTLVFLTLWVAVTQHGLPKGEALITAAAAVVLPMAAWLLWNETMYLAPQGSISQVPVANVNREAQLALLRAEPAKFLYVLGCREPLPGLHERYIAARWRQTLGSTMHCVAGDGVGILAGAVLSSVFGLAGLVEVVVEYILGFAFGWTIFQALFMRDMAGGSYLRAR